MRNGLAGVKQRVMDAMAKRAKQQCAGAGLAAARPVHYIPAGEATAAGNQRRGNGKMKPGRGASQKHLAVVAVSLLLVLCGCGRVTYTISVPFYRAGMPVQSIQVLRGGQMDDTRNVPYGDLQIQGAVEVEFRKDDALDIVYNYNDMEINLGVRRLKSERERERFTPAAEYPELRDSYDGAGVNFVLLENGKAYAVEVAYQTLVFDVRLTPTPGQPVEGILEKGGEGYPLAFETAEFIQVLEILQLKEFTL